MRTELPQFPRSREGEANKKTCQFSVIHVKGGNQKTVKHMTEEHVGITGITFMKTWSIAAPSFANGHSQTLRANKFCSEREAAKTFLKETKETHQNIKHKSLQAAIVGILRIAIRIKNMRDIHKASITSAQTELKHLGNI